MNPNNPSNPSFSLKTPVQSTLTGHKSFRIGLWLVTMVCIVAFAGTGHGAMQFVEAQYGGPVLDGAYNMATSPDGNHLYATGYYPGTIAHFERNAATGALTLTDIQRDGVNNVDGIDSVMDVVVSPDGRSLYAIGEWDNGLAVFSRNTLTGRLAFVEEQKEGVNGVDGLEGAVGVAVSPDNRHVYVAGYLEDSITVFSRDTLTSALTLVAVYHDGVNGIDGIAGASAITFSPDGDHLYVAGYFGDALAVFHRSSLTGELTFIEAFYDDTDGVDGLGGVCSLAMTGDGAYLYASSSWDDAVALFSRDDTSGRLTFVGAWFDGTGGITGLAGANHITISPDDSHVYVTGWFDDALVAFARDNSTGALSYLQTHLDDTGGVDGLYGARSVIVSPDGDHVYVAGEYDNGIGVFSRNDITGETAFVEMTWERYDSADGLDGAMDVTVSPDGAHLYAASDDDDSVAVFSRDSVTGKLTFIEAHKQGVNGVDGLSRAYAVTVSPDGAHLYAVGYGDDAVVLFERDRITGRLTFVRAEKDGINGVDGINGARAISISPDGGHVYVAGYLEDAVAVFARSSISGVLTFSQVVRDNTDGVDGLDAVRALAISPDGLFLYTASRSDSSVAVFSRDPDTGHLTFVENQRDGANGVDGIYGAKDVTLSPDGGYLYASGNYDDAVAVFSRDTTTGALTFVEMLKNGINGVAGLNGASVAVVSPDGANLYAAGYYDSAAVAFTRDNATGQLIFEQVARDGLNQVDGLSAISALTISPDGYHLYAAGEYDSAIAVFQIRTPPIPDTDENSGSSGGGSGCFINSLE